MSTRPSSIETKGNEKTEICNQQVNLDRGAIPYLPVYIDGYVARLGVTPGNFWWSCVTRFSRSDQTLSFFTPVFSPDLQKGGWVEISAAKVLSPDPMTKTVYFATQFEERDLNA